jgi:hypothetical protein
MYGIQVASDYLSVMLYQSLLLIIPSLSTSILHVTFATSDLFEIRGSCCCGMLNNIDVGNALCTSEWVEFVC